MVLRRRSSSCVGPGSERDILRLPSDTLEDYPRCMTERLYHWAEQTPDNVFLAQRERDCRAWRRYTFAEAMPLIESLAQALLDHGLSVDRPLVVLSGNSINHALLACAALHVGIPYVPVSPAYALVSKDFAKLRYVLELTTPGMVFVEDEVRFSMALTVACDPGVAVVATHPSGTAIAFKSLVNRTVTRAVAAAHASVTPDTIAKLLFTSGSTGMPKAVINTQRMLCSNQAMLAGRLSFLQQRSPVLVDWLPWHHTFGGNTILGMTVFNGGSLYIDDGSPTPEGIQRTVENLREISPTFYCNVPKGFEALVEFLREDAAFRDQFFGDLQMMHFGGAILPAHVREALETLGRQARGTPVPMLTGLGSTEACLAFFTDDASGMPGLVGRPVPGMAVKLIATGDKWEARIKGANVTPGYWRAADKTREAFDEEGYYRTGDAMRFVDPEEPERGLVFDGRLSENFKLITGTWVNVGTLRLQVIEHFAPLVQDVVIVGEGRGYLGGLIVLNPAGCEPLAGGALEPSHLSVNAAIRDWFAGRLVGHRKGRSSSMRLDRLMILDTPLSIDRGELTDKGSVNQRLVRERHTALIDELYREPPSSRAIVAD